MDDSKRTKCEVWSRVMGYLRPKQDYNLGKKQEHSDRMLFTESKAFETIDKMAGKDKL